MDGMLRLREGESRRRKRWTRMGSRSFHGPSSIAIRMILSSSSVSLEFPRQVFRRRHCIEWNCPCTCVTSESETH